MFGPLNVNVSAGRSCKLSDHTGYHLVRASGVIRIGIDSRSLFSLIYIVIWNFIYLSVLSYHLGLGFHMRWDLCVWCWWGYGVVARQSPLIKCAPDTPSLFHHDGAFCVDMSYKQLTCQRLVCMPLFLFPDVDLLLLSLRSIHPCGWSPTKFMLSFNWLES